MSALSLEEMELEEEIRKTEAEINQLEANFHSEEIEHLKPDILLLESLLACNSAKKTDRAESKTSYEDSDYLKVWEELNERVKKSKTNLFETSFGSSITENSGPLSASKPTVNSASKGSRSGTKNFEQIHKSQFAKMKSIADDVAIKKAQLLQQQQQDQRIPSKSQLTSGKKPSLFSSSFDKNSFHQSGSCASSAPPLTKKDLDPVNTSDLSKQTEAPKAISIKSNSNQPSSLTMKSLTSIKPKSSSETKLTTTTSVPIKTNQASKGNTIPIKTSVRALPVNAAAKTASSTIRKTSSNLLPSAASKLAVSTKQSTVKARSSENVNPTSNIPARSTVQKGNPNDRVAIKAGASSSLSVKERREVQMKKQQATQSNGRANAIMAARGVS